MSDINGTFITEIDGTKFYTQGIQRGDLWVTGTIGAFSFSGGYDAISGQSLDGSGFGGKIGGNVGLTLSTDSQGNLYFGGSAKAFSAGVVQYADGSEGIFLGADYGLPGLSLGVSVSGTISDGTNLSSYNSIQVLDNGSHQKTSFVPGNGTGYPVQAIIVKYDAMGNPVGIPLYSDVSNPYAHQMASGLAPHLYQATECFPADTPIQLASGKLTTIASIREGDQIAAFNGGGAGEGRQPDGGNVLNIENFRGRGGLDSKPVVQLFENITDTWIKLSNGLTVTPGHHFLDAKGGFRAIADILADDSQIVLADGTIASVSGEYIHYSAETADMFEQAEGYQPVGARQNAQSVGNLALAQSAVGGGSHMPHAGGLGMPHAGGLVFKKSWKTYNFEVADFRDFVARGVPTNDNSIAQTTSFTGTPGIAPYKNGAHAHQKLAA